MKHWPTKSRRPLRRATFGHAATIDHYIRYVRNHMRAAELGEIDWILHRRNCNPFRVSSPAHRAYERGFAAQRRATYQPQGPPLPDLPRARGRKGHTQHNVPTNSDANLDEI